MILPASCRCTGHGWAKPVSNGWLLSLLNLAFHVNTGLQSWRHRALGFAQPPAFMCDYSSAAAIGASSKRYEESHKASRMVCLVSPGLHEAAELSMQTKPHFRIIKPNHSLASEDNRLAQGDSRRRPKLNRRLSTAAFMKRHEGSESLHERRLSCRPGIVARR